MPVIKRVNSVKGKTLTFRDAVPEYAEFIFKLRTDASRSKYISRTEGGLRSQINWLENYQASQGQAYFVIFFDDQAIGTVRLYDAIGDSFCWGSWVLVESAPYHAAIESALIVYSYALIFLGFNNAHFDVRKGNIKVSQFHERFGARIIGEDNDSYYYEINQERINESLHKYKKFLEHSLIVSDS